MDRHLQDWMEGGVPILGICLGTQVVLEASEENQTSCLGLVGGTVRRFPAGMVDPSGKALKIPHMGWNEVAFSRPHPVFAGIPQGGSFYFVHSYYPAPTDEDNIVGWADYGIRFCAALAQKNLVAVQFHPEKSGRMGLKLLANFCRWGGTDAH
jgi:glutamine amidotransferase